MQPHFALRETCLENHFKFVSGCCLEKTGQWLENVDRANLVLASGKLELQKSLPQVLKDRGKQAWDQFREH